MQRHLRSALYLLVYLVVMTFLWSLLANKSDVALVLLIVICWVGVLTLAFKLNKRWVRNYEKSDLPEFLGGGSGTVTAAIVAACIALTIGAFLLVKTIVG